ncbi:MAG: hypothetical protein M5R41_14555 [Bacteroidia bacterium]|nr:hypothetical protein [Bacteroidia bacterium]
MQSSILRYSVMPFSGTFQSTVDEGSVHGLSATYDVTTHWSLMLEVEWHSFGWSVKRGDDPLITLEMAERGSVHIPVLFRYKSATLSMPFYIALGAVFTIPGNSSERVTLSYKGFSEREAWTSYEFRFDTHTSSLHPIAEAGVDVDLGASLSLLLAARYQAGTEDLVASQRLGVQSLSVWRLRAALYIAL